MCPKLELTARVCQLASLGVLAAPCKTLLSLAGKHVTAFL